MKFIVKLEEQDVNKVFNWVNKVGSDPTELWNILVPIIRKEADKEFTDSNPNNWKALTLKYKILKAKQGFPQTIGVRTGILKEAATTKATIIRSNGKLSYSVNNSMDKGYFNYFQKRRNIFKYTKAYIKSIYKEVTQRWLNEDIKKKKGSI